MERHPDRKDSPGRGGRRAASRPPHAPPNSSSLRGDGSSRSRSELPPPIAAPSPLLRPTDEGQAVQEFSPLLHLPRGAQHARAEAEKSRYIPPAVAPSPLLRSGGKEQSVQEFSPLLHLPGAPQQRPVQGSSPLLQAPTPAQAASLKPSPLARSPLNPFAGPATLSSRASGPAAYSNGGEYGSVRSEGDNSKDAEYDKGHYGSVNHHQGACANLEFDAHGHPVYIKVRSLRDPACVMHRCGNIYLLADLPHFCAQSGVPMVETADIRLETMTAFGTYIVFLLPYACLALALWLDTSGFSTFQREVEPGSSACQAGQCQWHVPDPPATNSFLRLSATFVPTDGVDSFSPTPPPMFGTKSGTAESSNTLLYTVGTSVSLRGLTNDGWMDLYEQRAVDNTQVVRCTHSACDSLTMLHVFFDSPGLLGWYSEYEIVAEVQVISDASGSIGEGGALLAQGASYSVSMDSEVYAKTLTYTRFSLLLLTVAVMVVWLSHACKSQEWRFFRMADRLYLTFMLGALFSWQNPVMAVISWMPSVTDRLLVCSDISQSTGFQLMWLCWVSLMDGQHFTSYKRSEGSGMAAFGTVSDTPYAALADTPHHHPSSDFFVDFIAGKGLYTLLALLVGYTIDFLRHPEASIPYEHSDHAVKLAYVVLSAIAGLITAGWVIWYARVALKTGRVLKGQPFMTTRRQQLAYRVMLSQAFLLVLLLGTGLGAQLVQLAAYVHSHTSVAAIGTTWKGVLGSQASMFSSWARGFRTPLGELIFMSASVYALVYIFLPPRHSIHRKSARMYVSMEKDLPSRHLMRQLAHSHQLQPVFCLERACLLCEVAWQSYYDPHKLALDDIVAPGRQDLNYLGLELVEGGYIYDEETEARVILCRGEDRLVLAFRGTATLNNLKTDISLKQLPLPQLRSSGSAPLVIKDPLAKHSSTYRRRRSADLDVEKATSVTAGADDQGAGTAIRNCATAVLNYIPVARQSLPLVHSGFWEMYTHIRSRMMEVVVRELQRDYKPLYVTGHSLGRVVMKR
jgi:hypothetical protein